MENMTEKNENVRKINKLGKVSRIIANIAKVCIIIVIVSCFIGGFAVLALPSDSISIKGTANAEIVVDDDIFPKNAVNIEESNFDQDIFGMSLKWIVKDTGVKDGKRVYTVDGNVEELDGDHVKAGLSIACFAAAIGLAILAIIVSFAKSLASALEKCNSPFETEVIDAMKKFGYSLIPLAVFKVILGGISLIGTVVPVLVILAFIWVFKYGAELQKQSDETL